MAVFYLGTHMPAWLSIVDVSLMVSHRRLRDRSTLPCARAPWALDSGGFTELSMYGQWTTTPGEYAAAVSRYRDEIGQLAWAAPQDWMCEPVMLAKTGLSVTEHQARTVASYLTLRDLAPDLPWIPVLQGWDVADYLRHVDAYARVGVDLATVPVVGLGSVCRRQHTEQIATLAFTLACLGICLHGFGVKTQGLAAYASWLASADSMAWSARGRRLPGCTPSHRSEANCRDFALAWRADVLAAVGEVS